MYRDLTDEVQRDRNLNIYLKINNSLELKNIISQFIRSLGKFQSIFPEGTNIEISSSPPSLVPSCPGYCLFQVTQLGNELYSNSAGECGQTYHA